MRNGHVRKKVLTHMKTRKGQTSRSQGFDVRDVHDETGQVCIYVRLYVQWCRATREKSQDNDVDGMEKNDILCLDCRVQKSQADTWVSLKDKERKKERKTMINCTQRDEDCLGYCFCFERRGGSACV